MIEVTRDALFIDINEISFARVPESQSYRDAAEELFEPARGYYRSIQMCVTAEYDGNGYICDGVDPTTGDFITDEILNNLSQYLQNVKRHI